MNEASANEDVTFVRLSEMAPQDHAVCFARLAAKSRSTTRTGRPYYRAHFQDAARTVCIMIWQDGGWFDACEEHWQVGQVYQLRGRYFENQFGPHFEPEQIEQVDPQAEAVERLLAELIPVPKIDAVATWEQLFELAQREIADEPLRELVLPLLTTHRDALLEMPNSSRQPQSEPGGLLAHTLAVTELARDLADRLDRLHPELTPPLDRGLVIAGAIVHDLGKLVASKQAVDSMSEMTPVGRLIGHIVLGRDLVRDAAEAAKLPLETRLRLEHLVLSHQSSADWGSPVAPMTPEALIVATANELEFRYHALADALATPKSPGNEEFSSKENPLRRRIFRGLNPAPLAAGGQLPVAAAVPDGLQ